ncbi:ABC transporter substrate-binding protein [Roseomonas sp. CCTCC AB2023176]|uniref:ABC transporter substrate-binding protein n=1 Tax=Roseomonas sp. CCTCC AB2023176 TaxID=3342640 RepID=UPI0035E36A16
MQTRRALLGALAAPAFLPHVAGAQADPRPVLRVAVQALPPTLEPLETISNVGLRLTDNVFDTLWRRDFLAEMREGGSHLGPYLATSLTRRDPLTWVADLRPGVRFHDGSEMTAEDVLSTFSAARMWGPEVPYFEGRLTFGHLAGVELEGRHRVVFRTRTPDVVMPPRLAAYGGWVHSARAASEGGAAGMRTRPIGTGPYRYASFQRDARATLESHDDWWGGRPPARGAVFTVVPEASSRLAGVLAGDFDIATNLLPEQIESLRRNPSVEGISVNLDLAHILFYDTRRPALRDARVRQGLNHAVDYDALGRALWGPDFRRMAALQVPAFGDLYEAERRGFAYDPDRARRLLREGGYRGEEIVIRIAPTYYLNILPAVQVIQGMWSAIGVNSRLETRENAALVQQPGADVRPVSVAFRFADPLGGGLAVHLAREQVIQSGGFWTPTRFNELVDAFRAASEPEDRKRLWHALLDEFEAEAPALILYPAREIFAKRRAVRFTHYPLYYLDLRPTNLGFTA